LAANNINRKRVRETVRALSYRNYRIYFFAMLVSFSGTWMQTVAQSWLVYRLTGSAWLLGLVGFASQAPVFLFTPLGGVMADRRSRHRIVVLTQVASMVQAFVLAALTMSEHITVNGIVVLALVLGIINAFDLPARQSFLVELVGKRDLMNAISLNSTMVNGARIVGPAVAGLIVAWLGEGLCFLINGLSYLVVILGLLAIRVSNGQGSRPEGSALSSLIEGFDYVRRSRPVRAVLLLVALVSVCGLPYIVLMPIFADDVVGGGPRALGILLGAAGVGALGGGLFLATRSSAKGLGRLVALCVTVFGVTIVSFSFSTNLIISTALLIPAGFTLMVQMSGSNTLLQTIVPDRMRGRAMSFYAMSLMGMAPFGSLFAGAVATRIGAPHTVAAGGILCIAGALLFRFYLPGLGVEEGSLMIDQSTTPAADEAAAITVDGGV
jgi:MFS family permease